MSMGQDFDQLFFFFAGVAASSGVVDSMHAIESAEQHLRGRAPQTSHGRRLTRRAFKSLIEHRMQQAEKDRDGAPV